ncbi:hypothetical protein [Sporolactobacillus vineae]|uniref:hypothetical protein n=1 Tax=Sporolactobacillus vineae TaxID=444463 RepID=UPI00036804B0|nr:hypothetical protein [Sporolactobacillus vineae]
MELREHRRFDMDSEETGSQDTADQIAVRLNRKLLVTNFILAISIIINVKLFFG